MKTRGVEDGTKVDGKGLCLSCRNACIMRGHNEKQQFVYCRASSEAVKFKVLECTDYDDKSKPSLGSMH